MNSINDNIKPLPISEKNIINTYPFHKKPNNSYKAWRNIPNLAVIQPMTNGRLASNTTYE
jgi:hypothetical protein